MTSTQPMYAHGSTPLPFREDCKQVLQGLRGVLTDALISVGVDPAKPQEVARLLGLHRNLTWKVSKIITGANVFSAVAHVPGRGGMEILCKALRKQGVADGVLKRINEAMDAFDRLITTHAGDRATLELVAGGFVPGASQAETLLQARRLAYRGNSATWSVQTRVGMTANILAPAADDPRRVDIALVNGLVDFRRLRQDVVWPLFQRQTWDDSGSVKAVDGDPIEPQSVDHGVPLLRSFCSPDLPDLNVVHSESLTEYELPAGPVGRTGELTAIYAAVMRSLGSQYASGEDKTCELACKVTTPTELLHVDMLVHESLTWAMEPRSDVLSLLEGRPIYGRHRGAQTRLKVESDVHELGQGLGTMATPHIPRYTELLAYVFDRLGWEESEFRGFRFTLNYPPIPSVAMVSMDLMPDGEA
jgi:hypothetical protein